MNPTFYKITVCQIITLFGNAALRFALPLYLLRRIDSAALYGSVTALALCRCCWARWQGACWQTAAVNKKSWLCWIPYPPSAWPQPQSYFPPRP